MSALVLSITPEERSYFANLGQASVGLVKALFGFADVQPTASSTVLEVEGVASRYEDVMPALASELRYMVAHA